MKELEAADQTQMLEQLRVNYLGKKGQLKQILKSMGNLPKAELPLIGQLANEVRDVLSARLDERKRQLQAFEEERRLKSEQLDVTVPGICPPRGAAHPVEQVIDLITRIFIGMGYSIAEGPEIELVRTTVNIC